MVNEMGSSDLLLIFLSCVLHFTVNADECLERTKRLGGYQATFNGRCYKFVTSEETWIKANRNCKSWGGNLVSIPDKATMDFLRRTLSQRGWSNNGVWIGAHARGGGGWRWTTGEAMTFQYWASGQPSTTGGISFEDCGQMRRSDGWRWHDYHCNFFLYTYRYICQFDTRKGGDVEGSLANTDSRSNHSDKDTGIVVGFVIGGILLVAIFVLATIFLRRRRRKPFYEANVRFSNLSYMHVNRQSPDHAAPNVYVDANEMNKLYEEVNKLTNHGVNYNEVGGATSGEAGAVGEPIYDVPDDITSCKAENMKLNNAVGEKSTGVSITKLGPKKMNSEMEEKRVVDPDKPCNLRCQQSMYVNTDNHATSVADDNITPGASNNATLESDGGYEEPVSASSLQAPSEQTDIKQEHLYDEVN